MLAMICGLSDKEYGIYESLPAIASKLKLLFLTLSYKSVIYGLQNFQNMKVLFWRMKVLRSNFATSKPPKTILK